MGCVSSEHVSPCHSGCCGLGEAERRFCQAASRKSTYLGTRAFPQCILDYIDAVFENHRHEMGSKARKRDRDPAPSENDGDVPVKRRRQINEDQVKLAKLYDDLAAESDDVRFNAAKQLILKFSPESAPSATDVETALSRLVRGLCSQRKAARVGFSLTLTELLRQIFGPNRSPVEGLKHDVPSLIKLVEDKTKVEGNVPGRVGQSSRYLISEC